MSKKSRRKRLFKAKILAISGAAVFMIVGVKDMYADIQRGTGIKKEAYAAKTVEENVTSILDAVVTAEPEEMVMETVSADALKECQETGGDVGYDSEDAYLLVKIAMAEAESEGVEGKALVILVVLNRVKSNEFPDSISEVIFQPGQFSPVKSGRYDRVEPDIECYEALELVQTEGWDKSQGALYFESESKSDWHKNNLHFLFQHGSHYFYTDKELAE